MVQGAGKNLERTYATDSATGRANRADRRNGKQEYEGGMVGGERPRMPGRDVVGASTTAADKKGNNEAPWSSPGRPVDHPALT